jgi:hypothetical protein
MPPFNFDNDNYEDNYDQNDEYADAQENYTSNASDPIQERLDLAFAYRALLQRGVFNDGTPATERVEKEVQTFVRERLDILMGIRPEVSKTESIFNDEEVKILKAFANRVKNQGTVTPTVKPPEPAPTEIKPIPTVKPVVKPTVRSPKPRAPRKPREVAPRAPQQETVSMNVDKDRKYPMPRNKEESERIPDNDVFKIGPKYYMWRTNEHGLRYRVNVTPQAGQTEANKLYTPMPTGALFTAITAEMSQSQAKQGKNATDMGGRDID